MTINELKETLADNGVELSLEKVGGEMDRNGKGCVLQCAENTCDSGACSHIGTYLLPEDRKRVRMNISMTTSLPYREDNDYGKYTDEHVPTCVSKNRNRDRCGAFV